MAISGTISGANSGPPGALVEALFDGIFEQPLWSGFLAALRDATAADYASLIFRPPAPGRPSVVHLHVGGGPSPSVRQHYLDHLLEDDPFPYLEFREGEVYALEDLLDADDRAHQTIARELLAASGMTFVRQMRVMEPSGVNVWLTLSRGAATFGASDHALVAGLAPYLRTALRSWVALERERFAAAVSGEATRRLDFGWLTLDAFGFVVDSDARGTQILEGAGMLARGAHGGRPHLGRAVVAAIEALLADPAHRSRALVLSREPWLDMLLVPTDRQAISSGHAPTVVAYVHAEGGSSADRCDQLAQLFGLLPSEARLALALSRGMTIAEAAGELGLTIETARSYSKKIYSKTGARGQTDLVRFIHRSVLAIV